MGHPRVRVAIRWRDAAPEGQCPTCRDWWALTPEFWTVNGGMRRCSACFREYNALRMRGVRADDAHATIIRTRQRIAYAANRTKHLAAAQRWREANPDKVRAYRRAYYLAHRIEEIAQARTYYDECRDVILLKKRDRKAA